jgi:hypothetical protein
MAAPDAAQITRWRRRRPFEDAQSACVPAPGQPAPGRRRHPPAITGHALEGTSTANPELLAYLVEDRLGREVHWDNAEPTEPDEEGQSTTAYEFRPSEGSDTAVCVQFTLATGSDQVQISMDQGECSGA